MVGGFATFLISRYTLKQERAQEENRRKAEREDLKKSQERDDALRVREIMERRLSGFSSLLVPFLASTDAFILQEKIRLTRYARSTTSDFAAELQKRGDWSPSGAGPLVEDLAHIDSQITALQIQSPNKAILNRVGKVRKSFSEYRTSRAKAYKDALKSQEGLARLESDDSSMNIALGNFEIQLETLRSVNSVYSIPGLLKDGTDLRLDVFSDARRNSNANNATGPKDVPGDGDEARA